MAKSASTTTPGQTSALLKTLLKTTVLTAAGLATMSGGARADNPWAGMNIVAGSAGIDYGTPDVTTINQSSQRAIGEANNLDILGNQRVRINQNNADALFVGRAVGAKSDPTKILGQLSANGKVMVLDRNGVIFGKDAVIDVGGIIASTGKVSNADIMDGDGRFEFTDFGSGQIVNEGTITVADAGIAAFVSPYVSNNGIINAKLGKVALAAGNKVTLDLYGDNLIEIAVDDKVGDALLQNSGTINAEGGKVLITAQAAKEALENVINMDGVINASSASVEGGKIVLSGGEKGTVRVSGKLNASGTKGGKVQVKGQNIAVAENAEINVDASQGNGGRTEIIADDHADFRGSVSGRGGLTGNGGFAEVSGLGSLGFSGYADLSAENGALGTLLLDPAFAVIHSGNLHDPLSLGYVLSARALANSMRNANITVSATNFIDVGTRIGSYNSGIPAIDTILNAIVGTGPINLSTSNSPSPAITNGSITLSSNVVNFNKDLTLGNGNLAVNASTVNLDGKIFTKAGLATSSVIAGDSRISSNAGTVNVKSNAALIQQGLYLANDAGGAAVNVAAGTYDESVLVNKSLGLRGANAGISVNDLRGPETILAPHSPGVHVTADNVAVEGFTINGADDGVLVDSGADNAVVVDNIINNSTISGIHFVNSADSFASGNRINGGSKGIISDSSANATILNNIISGGGIGIDVYASNGAVVDGNIIYNTNGSGISILDSADMKVTGNFIGYNDAGLTSAGVYNIKGDGIVADNANRITIQSNKIVDTDSTGFDIGSAIHVKNSDGALIGGAAAGEGNTISNIAWDGIKLGNDTNVSVQGNNLNSVNRVSIYAGNVATGTIAGNTLFYGGDSVPDYGAISADGGSNLTISANTLLSSLSHGIFLKGTGGTNLLEENILNGISRDALRFESVSNATVLKNKIGSLGSGANGHGIHFIVGSNNIIDGNDVHDVGANGIYLETNASATVRYNNVDDTAGYGMLLDHSDNSVIFSNEINKNVAGAQSVLDGIRLQGSNNVSVSNNYTNLTGGAGINVFDGNDVAIFGNTVTKASGDGIFADRAAGVLIQANTVTDSALSGIHITRSNGAVIGGMNFGLINLGNTIDGAGSHGVRVRHSDGVYVGSNTIQNIDHDGIRFVNDSDDGVIENNTIINANTGIRVTDSSNHADIFDNLIVDSVYNGISAGSVTDIIQRNTVLNSGHDGIYVLNSPLIEIGYNTVSGSGHDGIALGTNSDGAIIEYNDISASLNDGISVNGSGNVLVWQNDIFDSGDDGVDANNANALDIRFNNIDQTGGNGISVNGGDFALIFSNEINKNVEDAKSGGDGIHITGTGNAEVNSNYTDNTDGNGIFLSGGIFADISSNNLLNAGIDGIYAENTGAATIANNTVSNAGDDGIDTAGIADLLIDGNTVSKSGDDGIHILGYAAFGLQDPEAPAPVFTATVTNNTVVDSGTPAAEDEESQTNGFGDGIQVQGFDTATISGNDVTNSVMNGLYVSGFNNGTVVVSGNTFTDNDIGAQFESGVIDLTGEGNIFNGGRVGLRFAPYAFETLVIPQEGGFAPLSLVDNDAPGADVLGGANPPTNFAGTIGAQSFLGQSQYFVELANGAFFAPGNPSILNGLNSTYRTTFGDITPSATGGVLSADVLAALENGFFHFPDTGDLGLFFFGYTPVAAPINQEDIFNAFGEPNLNTANFRITVLGLPTIPGGPPQNINFNAISPAAGGNTPARLNAIDTAAGDDATGAANPPAQNNSAPQSLNAIETASGGQDVNCWGDAATIAGGGKAVTINYDGTDEGTLNGAAACGASF